MSGRQRERSESFPDEGPETEIGKDFQTTDDANEEAQCLQKGWAEEADDHPATNADK